MKMTLLWVWQLPQNLIGFILSRFNCFNDNKLTDSFVVRVYYLKFIPKGNAFTLGDYILFSWRGSSSTKDILHEQGHSIQSRYFGPLYLFVIGIPSILGYLYLKFSYLKRLKTYEKDEWYYNLPWEKWADELGGVER